VSRATLAILLIVSATVYSEPTEVTTYAVTSELDLQMNVFLPDDEREAKGRSAVILYFGGGWRGGTPQQFFPFCEVLRERGMACFVPDYRVSSRQGTDGVDAMEDARSAYRWLADRASDYAVDPERIYAGGGSAGGHLAASLGLIPDAGGWVPKLAGLVLFNPAVDLVPGGVGRPRIEAMFRNSAAAYSPIEFVRGGLPPTWVVHGRADEVVPHSTVEDFCGRMQRKDNVCKLVSFDGAGHGFFNAGRPAHEDVVTALLRFLELD
jgi:acetyl esterase/lipase